MNWVQTARLYPQRCAVWPHVGATHPAGYIDTIQTTVAGERIYISMAALNALAEGVGFVRAGDESKALAEARVLRERVAELEKSAAEGARVVEAAQTLLDAREAVAA